MMHLFILGNASIGKRIQKLKTEQSTDNRCISDYLRCNYPFENVLGQRSIKTVAFSCSEIIMHDISTLPCLKKTRFEIIVKCKLIEKIIIISIY